MLFRSTTWWCAQAVDIGVVTIGSGGGVGRFAITNACPIPIDIPITITARPSHGDPGDPQVVRLNGLPPGIPWTESRNVGPYGTDPISINVEFDGYQPFRLYELTLEADTDGDGIYEELASVGLRSQEDSTGTVGEIPTEPLRTSTRIQGAPNPFQGQTAIDFTLARSQNVDVNVFDLNGRLIRRLHTGRLVAGKHVFRWNGNDGSDHRSPAGVYFVRLQSADVTLKTKIVRIE